MNRGQLREFLESENIRPDAYSLDDTWCSECYRIEPRGEEWAVYYAERGLRSGERIFESEEAACEFLASRLLSDPDARRS
jgi:hypothetical protein